MRASLLSGLLRGRTRMCWLLSAAALSVAACGGQGVQGAQGGLGGGSRFAGATFWPPASRLRAPDAPGTTLDGKRG